jgi:hypothetical protein
MLLLITPYKRVVSQQQYPRGEGLRGVALKKGAAPREMLLPDTSKVKQFRIAKPKNNIRP